MSMGERSENSANSARTPRTTSAGPRAARHRTMGMTFAFQPRRAPSALSAPQRARDQTAAPRPWRAPS